VLHHAVPLHEVLVPVAGPADVAESVGEPCERVVESGEVSRMVVELLALDDPRG
jgi:hypothetical protein